MTGTGSAVPPDAATLLEENRRLRRTMGDLVALSALPAIWTRLGVEGAAGSLADTLLRMLSLDLVHLRLSAGEGRSAEVLRGREPMDDATSRRVAGELVRAVAHYTAPECIANPFGDGELCVAVTRFGVGGDHGTMITASTRPDFPTESERLLLGVGANQTAVVLQRGLADEKARASEVRFRALMEQAPFSVQIFSPDGRTIGVNRAWEELWGASFEQLGDYNILHDHQLAAHGVLHHVERAFAGEPGYVPPVRYDPQETVPHENRNEDSVRWVAAVAYPLKDEQGVVREVVLVHDDITARRKAEAAVHESEERLRLLADTIPQLAWMTDPAGEPFWFNRRWYEYTGTTPEQLGTLDRRALIDPAVLPEVLGRWSASLESGEPFDMVYPLRGGDGEYRSFLTRVNPLRDSSGRIIRWLGTSTDISEIMRMEADLRDADRRKDEFLATLAHELRNPLAPLRNSLEILKMPRLDAATMQQTRGMMERQVHSLVRLVDDLLDVSRVMRGTIELRREPVEIASVVARAVETVQPLIEVQEQQLHLRLSPESMVVDADPVRLAQVIGNLLMNAAKYTDARGEIEVAAEVAGDDVVVTVRDDGIGIAPEMLSRVFDLFVQLDHAASRAQGGLGIGLTLVKNLVGMHGGSVVARSGGAGKGSEFEVRIPRMADERQGEPALPPQSRNEVTSSGLRLLVVDDNRDAATSLALMLRLHGHEVRTAHDGPAAVELAAEFRPDLIFLDIGMPGMDGYEVARLLRRQPALGHVVLAALTGWGQDEDRRRTRVAGFDHHLVKPPELADVERVLAAVQRR